MTVICHPVLLLFWGIVHFILHKGCITPRLSQICPFNLLMCFQHCRKHVQVGIFLRWIKFTNWSMVIWVSNDSQFLFTIPELTGWTGVESCLHLLSPCLHAFAYFFLLICIPWHGVHSSCTCSMLHPLSQHTLNQLSVQKPHLHFLSYHPSFLVAMLICLDVGI